MSDSILGELACVYNRSDRWRSVDLLNGLVQQGVCSHVAVAVPRGGTAHFIELLVTVSSPCYQRRADGSQCQRSFGHELWVICRPNLAATRRRPWEPSIVRAIVRSLQPERLRLLDQSGKIVDRVALSTLVVNPAFGVPENIGDHLVDDDGVNFEVYPSAHRQSARIEVEARAWPNPEEKGNPRRLKTILTVTIPSKTELDQGLAIRVAEEDTAILDLLASMSAVSIADFRIVGNYCRFDNRVRSSLRAWRDRILSPLQMKTNERENFLVAAAPGSGKSFFVEEIAKSLGHSIDYLLINFATVSRTDLGRAIEECKNGKKPTLCLLDEIDARPDEKWLYNMIFTLLGLNSESADRQAVFVLVGSKPGGVEALAIEMAMREKGGDLVSRVPMDRRFEIPSVLTEDRLIVMASSIIKMASRRGCVIEAVEKLAYFYAAAKHLSPRHLDDLVSRGLSRLAAAERVLRYSHLFDPADSENQRFWAQHLAVARALGNDTIDLHP